MNSVLGIRVDRTRIFVSPTFMQDPFCCDSKRCDENPNDKHNSVVAASIFSLELTGQKIVDGVILSPGDRVLVKDQTDKKDNGIYIVEDDSWTRASDASVDGQLKKGSYVYVERGSVNKNTTFSLITEGIINIGTTPNEWASFLSSADDEEALSTTKVVNSVYEGVESVEILMNPDYFFKQFTRPVSWLYLLIKAKKENYDPLAVNHFTNFVRPNRFREVLYGPRASNWIVLLNEDGTDEKVGNVFSRRFPEKTSIVLRYWPVIGTEPFFLFLDYLAMPNSEYGGKRLPDGYCGFGYKWVFNHNRNYHDLVFSFGDSKVPAGTELTPHGALNISSFPTTPDDWYITLLVKDKVKNLTYEGRFDIKSRTPVIPIQEEPSPLDIKLEKYAFGSCENVRVTANFEVNYNYSATRIISVTGGTPPYRFNFYTESDNLYKPASFHTPANNNPDWFGFWKLEDSIAPPTPTPPSPTPPSPTPTPPSPTPTPTPAFAVASTTPNAQYYTSGDGSSSPLNGSIYGGGGNTNIVYTANRSGILSYNATLNDYMYVGASGYVELNGNLLGDILTNYGTNNISGTTAISQGDSVLVNFNPGNDQYNMAYLNFGMSIASADSPLKPRSKLTPTPKPRVIKSTSWVIDQGNKIKDFTNVDVNSYKTDYANDNTAGIIQTIDDQNYGLKPKAFTFMQINDNTIFFIMDERGFYSYGYEEIDKYSGEIRWAKQALKLRVEDSAGNRDEIEIFINNCSKYEKVWTLDETYYQDASTETEVRIDRVSTRDFINAYGTFYFSDTLKPQLNNEYLRYNNCGIGAKPNEINR
jgi:hypothetical protein